ncbi:MAG: glycerate kinase [Gemmataceae bacterium]
MREQAREIWAAGLAAARPAELIRAAVAADDLRESLAAAARILVVGAGKAGATMSHALEDVLDLSGWLERVEGWVNVPADAARPLRRITLHAARPAASNHPTAEGVMGSRKILELVRSARSEDVVLCLLSGGGSALLPAPASGLSLEDKQQATRLLHACGATINEMNAVRKHLSAIKGGQLARAFHGKRLVSLIISDVIGDPLDVIASGPTAADPTTFADSLAIVDRFQLRAKLPAAVIDYLEGGARGERPETLKELPAQVSNRVIGNNAGALRAAAARAEQFGYRVVNLGAFVEGETRQVAVACAGIVRSLRVDGQPVLPPACVLIGGETTVTLASDHGRGGRNQEFVLALLHKLGQAGCRDVVALSAGTDGEDGPTDAAGAFGDADTLARAAQLNLDVVAYLDRNDANHFFDATGDLLKTGLTGTNVMDIRVMLVK